MTEDGPWASDTVTYTYDNRLRAALSLAQPSGSWSQTYGYDAGKRLKTLVSGAGTFSYDYPDGTRLAAGSRLPEQLNLPVGYITNVYDTLARLQNTSLRAPAGTALDWEGYAYNNASQRTHQINALGGNYVSYAYDARGQLTNAAGYTSTGTARSQEKWAYTYDAAGNLSQRIKNALTNTFTVNNNNMASGVANSGTITVGGVTTPNALLVTVNGTPATLYTDDYSFALANVALTTPSIVALASNASGTISVTNTLSANATVTGNYDTNGNLTSDGTRLFTYDPDNQLVQVIVTNSSTKSAKTDFVYDGRMRRRVRTEAQWISSAWVTNTVVRYIYDGMRVIQERDANNNVLVTYTWGNDLSGKLEGAGGIGGLVARTHPGPHHFYYHSDGNGNITAAINEAKNLVAQYRYDPFGNLIYSKGALADINLYRFSSKEFTTNSGLYYYGFRFYDPNLQRWLNRDPIQEAGGINLYQFCRNTPINGVDRNGLDFWQWGGSFAYDGPGLSMEATHTALDVMGTFDPTPFSDGLNGLIYGAQGDWGNLGISAVAMVPYLGDAAKLGKYGKIACEVRVPFAKKPKLVHNPKHHPHSASPEPKNVEELYEKSVLDPNGSRYAKDADGTIHRFSTESNGTTHWNGSTGTERGLHPRQMPSPGTLD